MPEPLVLLTFEGVRRWDNDSKIDPPVGRLNSAAAEQSSNGV